MFAPRIRSVLFSLDCFGHLPSRGGFDLVMAGMECNIGSSHARNGTNRLARLRLDQFDLVHRRGNRGYSFRHQHCGSRTLCLDFLDAVFLNGPCYFPWPCPLMS